MPPPLRYASAVYRYVLRLSVRVCVRAHIEVFIQHNARSERSGRNGRNAGIKVVIACVVFVALCPLQRVH